MFCVCLTSGQIILSLKIIKLLYVKQTFEDTIYRFVACKNCALSVFNSDSQRNNYSSHSQSILCSLSRYMEEWSGNL